MSTLFLNFYFPINQGVKGNVIFSVDWCFAKPAGRAMGYGRQSTRNEHQGLDLTSTIYLNKI